MTQLVTVGFETFEGAHYTFPDMDKAIFEKVLDNESMWQRLGSIALSNISGACVVIPTRIIKQVLIDGEVKWQNPLISSA